MKCWLASVFGKLGVSQGWKTLLEHSGNIKKVLASPPPRLWHPSQLHGPQEHLWDRRSSLHRPRPQRLIPCPLVPHQVPLCWPPGMSPSRAPLRHPHAVMAETGNEGTCGPMAWPSLQSLQERQVSHRLFLISDFLETRHHLIECFKIFFQKETALLLPDHVHRLTSALLQIELPSAL